MIKRLFGAFSALTLSFILLYVGAKTAFLAPSEQGDFEFRQAQQRSLHTTFAVQADDVVFIGDDLTALAPWSEVFPGLRIKNRGVQGDTSASLLFRAASIAKAKPKAVIINIGANDVATLVPLQETSGNLRELLSLMQTLSPDTAYIVQSAMPLMPEHMPAIEAINKTLEQIALQRKIAYVDPHSLLFLANGQLREGMGLNPRHLLGTAYSRWANLLESLLYGNTKRVASIES